MELNLDWQARESASWPGVRYEIRPLKVWAFQELMALWEEGGGDEPGGVLGPARTLALMQVARRIFPEHVRHLAGLTLRRDGEAQPATPDALCEEAPLLPLAGEIVTQLLEASDLGAGDEKN